MKRRRPREGKFRAPQASRRKFSRVSEKKILGGPFDASVRKIMIQKSFFGWIAGMCAKKNYDLWILGLKWTGACEKKL